MKCISYAVCLDQNNTTKQKLAGKDEHNNYSVGPELEESLSGSITADMGIHILTAGALFPTTDQNP